MGGRYVNVQLDKTLSREYYIYNNGRILLGDQLTRQISECDLDKENVLYMTRNYGRRIEGPWVILIGENMISFEENNVHFIDVILIHSY